MNTPRRDVARRPDLLVGKGNGEEAWCAGRAESWGLQWEYSRAPRWMDGGAGGGEPAVNRHSVDGETGPNPATEERNGDETKQVGCVRSRRVQRWRSSGAEVDGNGGAMSFELGSWPWRGALGRGSIQRKKRRMAMSLCSTVARGEGEAGGGGLRYRDGLRRPAQRAQVRL